MFYALMAWDKDGALDVRPGDPVRFIPWSGFGL